MSVILCWFFLGLLFLDEINANKIHTRISEIEIQQIEMFNLDIATDLNISLLNSTQRYKRQIALLPFAELVKQRIQGNNVAQVRDFSIFKCMLIYMR